MTTAQQTIDTQVADVALDWLKAKDAEDVGKAAKKIRIAAATWLRDVLGHDGEVTVNKGGFKTFRLAVSDRERVSEGRVLATLEARHPELATEISALKAEFTNGFQVIALKPLKR